MSIRLGDLRDLTRRSSMFPTNARQKADRRGIREITLPLGTRHSTIAYILLLLV